MLLLIFIPHMDMGEYFLSYLFPRGIDLLKYMFLILDTFPIRVEYVRGTAGYGGGYVG